MSFPKPFNSVPDVVLTTDNDSFVLQLSHNGVTTTGFSGYAKNNASGITELRNIYWIAIA